MIEGLNSPVFFYSSLTTFTLLLLAGMCFVFSLRDRSELHRRLFRHWSLGFFLLIWDKVPIMFSALGLEFFPERLTNVYLVAFILHIVALFLLSRGFLLPFLKSTLVLDIVALVIVGGGFLLSLFAYLLLGSVAIGLIFVKLATYLAVTVNVAVALTLLLSRRKSVEGWRPHLGLIFIILGWVIVLVTRAFVWHIISESSTSWFNVIVAIPGVHAGLLFAVISFLIGVALLGRHREAPPPQGRRMRALLGLDIVGVTVFGIIVIAIVYSGSTFAGGRGGVMFLEKRGGGELIEGHPAIFEVYAESGIPWNALEGVLRIPQGLRVTEVDLEGSAIPLWVVPPALPDEEGRVPWSGGILRGIAGRALVFRLKVEPQIPGRGEMRITDASILASDGHGTPIETEVRRYFYNVLATGAFASDVNGDGELNVRDISAVLSHYGEKGGPYDLNLDGVVDLEDARMILSFVSQGRFGSRGYLP